MKTKCSFKEDKNHWSWKYNLYFKLNVTELVLSRLQSDCCSSAVCVTELFTKPVLVRELLGSAGKQKMLGLSQNVFLLLLGASAQALLMWGEACDCAARIVQGFWKCSLLSNRSEFLPLVHDETQVLLCYKEGRCSVKL